MHGIISIFANAIKNRRTVETLSDGTIRTTKRNIKGLTTEITTLKGQKKDRISFDPNKGLITDEYHRLRTSNGHETTKIVYFTGDTPWTRDVAYETKRVNHKIVSKGLVR